MEANPISQVKPGLRSTEFWLTVGIILLWVLGAVEGFIPPEHALGFATLTSVIYKALRTAIKIHAGTLDLKAMEASLNLDGVKADAFARAETASAMKAVAASAAPITPATDEAPRHTEDPFPAPGLAHPVSRPLAGVGGFTEARFLAAIVLIAALAIAFLNGCAKPKPSTHPETCADCHAGNGWGAPFSSSQTRDQVSQREPDRELGETICSAAAQGLSPAVKRPSIAGDGIGTTPGDSIPPDGERLPFFRAAPPELRTPEDVPESWRRTLFHPGEDGAPRIIIPLFDGRLPLIVTHTLR